MPAELHPRETLNKAEVVDHWPKHRIQFQSFTLGACVSKSGTSGSIVLSQALSKVFCDICPRELSKPSSRLHYFCYNNSRVYRCYDWMTSSSLMCWSLSSITSNSSTAMEQGARKNTLQVAFLRLNYRGMEEKRQQQGSWPIL